MRSRVGLSGFRAEPFQLLLQSLLEVVGGGQLLFEPHFVVASIAEVSLEDAQSSVEVLGLELRLGSGAPLLRVELLQLAQPPPDVGQLCLKGVGLLLLALKAPLHLFAFRSICSRSASKLLLLLASN